eukprot:2815549-Pleurochrysis_carterae.AAC.2
MSIGPSSFRHKNSISSAFRHLLGHAFLRRKAKALNGHNLRRLALILTCTVMRLSCQFRQFQSLNRAASPPTAFE